MSDPLASGSSSSSKFEQRVGMNAFVVVRVLAEDVLDHDDRFLNDVADFRGDEVEQNVDATLGCSVDLDGALTDGADGSAHKVDIHLEAYSFEFGEEHVDIALVASLIMISTFSSLT